MVNLIYPQASNHPPSLSPPNYPPQPQPDAQFERRAWAYPLPYSEHMMEAFRLRGQLVPYLYSALLDFQATGVSPIRPVYYDHAEDDAAYRFNDTYFFGDDIFVAPIVAPQDNSTWLATREFWLPTGEWCVGSYIPLTERRRGFLGPSLSSETNATHLFYFFPTRFTSLIFFLRCCSCSCVVPVGGCSLVSSLRPCFPF